MFQRSPVLCLALAVATLSCAEQRQALEEEIEKRVVLAAKSPPPAEPAQNQPEPSIVVNSVLPSYGASVGGDLVEIVGLGFEVGMRVRFGDVVVEESFTEVFAPNRILCRTPAHEAGISDVTVSDPTREGLLAEGFYFYDLIDVTDLDPAEAPSEGGTVVTIYGEGFSNGTVVLFGASQPVAASVASSTQLTVTTPPLLRGTYDVTVANQYTMFTLPQAFTSFDPLKIVSVTPFAGPLSGNTQVRIVGLGFTPTTQVVFGSVPQLAVAFSAEELIVTTAPAAAEGAVDVRASTHRGSKTKRNGYAFYDPNDDTPRIISVAPAVGVVEGGTTVRIAGTGLAGSPTQVFFGEEEADCEVVDEHQVDCVAPALSQGTVDVQVVAGETTVSAEASFQAVDLKLTHMAPFEGAIAGGTFVRIFGNGFADDAEVFFDDVAAREVVVVSSQEITARTPRALVGTVDVRVSTLGLDVTSSGLYSYFDPMDLEYWSSGGPIEGSVNVTVFADGEGLVEGAFVMLGSASRTPYKGFTNELGQVTLSGPMAEIVGPLTVTAAKEKYAAFSWANVDAANLTLLLLPIMDPSPPPPGSGAPPPLIRGFVSRIKDDFNYGDDTVLVTTTFLDFRLPLPDPGPKAELIGMGEYELRARTGEMVVIAMAGHFEAAGFTVHALGFRPFVFTEPNSGTLCATDSECSNGEQCEVFGAQNFCIHVYEGIDIVVDTPLKQDLIIQFDNPPLARPTDPYASKPDTLRAFVYYDFGSMGLHPMGEKIEQGPARPELSMKMPVRLPEPIRNTPFQVEAGAYLGYDDDGNPATPLVLAPPLSEVILPGNMDTTQPVVLTPMLGTQNERRPTFGGMVGDPMSFSFSINKDVVPAAHLHLFADYSMMPVIRWVLLSPPSAPAGGQAIMDFDLPVFPRAAAASRLAAGPYIWQIQSLYAPTVVFNEMSVGQLFSSRITSLNLTIFTAPEVGN